MPPISRSISNFFPGISRHFDRRLSVSNGDEMARKVHPVVPRFSRSTMDLAFLHKLPSVHVQLKMAVKGGINAGVAMFGLELSLQGEVVNIALEQI